MDGESILCSWECPNVQMMKGDYPISRRNKFFYLFCIYRTRYPIKTHTKWFSQDSYDAPDHNKGDDYGDNWIDYRISSQEYESSCDHYSEWYECISEHVEVGWSYIDIFFSSFHEKYTRYTIYKYSDSSNDHHSGSLCFDGMIDTADRLYEYIYRSSDQ